MSTPSTSMFHRTAICAAFIASAAFTGCETPGQSALVGAGTGAIVGGALHGRGSDALKGAAIGAGAGYLAGRAVQHERRRAYEQGYDDSRYDGYDRRRSDRRGYYDRDGRWNWY